MSCLKCLVCSLISPAVGCSDSGLICGYGKYDGAAKFMSDFGFC